MNSPERERSLLSLGTFFIHIENGEAPLAVILSPFFVVTFTLHRCSSDGKTARKPASRSRARNPLSSPGRIHTARFHTRVSSNVVLCRHLLTGRTPSSLSSGKVKHGSSECAPSWFLLVSMCVAMLKRERASMSVIRQRDRTANQRTKTVSQESIRTTARYLPADVARHSSLSTLVPDEIPFLFDF